VKLRSQQTWFAGAVMSPAEAPVPADVDGFLRGGPRIGPGDRLQIYRDGYRSRLIECLADDYAVMKHLLGEESFDELAGAYIEAHPSDSPSLNFFGRKMASFVGGFVGGSGLAPLQGKRAFAADLARLEWALLEAIHAPPCEPFSLEQLAGIAPDAWGSVRLGSAAGVKLLRLAHPANAYFQAVRDDLDPAMPAPAASATLVHRKGWTVWRSDLTPPMAGVLEAILAGAPLGEALASLEGGEGEGGGDEAGAGEHDVAGWFRDWVSSGVFTSATSSPTSHE
jgi:hypothetical protein